MRLILLIFSQQKLMRVDLSIKLFGPPCMLDAHNC